MHRNWCTAHGLVQPHPARPMTRQTAVVLVELGPRARVRSQAVAAQVDEGFARLTDAPRIGDTRFAGYVTAEETPAPTQPGSRFARFEADFEVEA